MTKKELIKYLEMAGKSANDLKLLARDEGHILRQERFYGMEIAYHELLLLIRDGIVITYE